MNSLTSWSYRSCKSRLNTLRQISRCNSAYFSAVADAHPLPISPFGSADGSNNDKPTESLGCKITKAITWHDSPPQGVPDVESAAPQRGTEALVQIASLNTAARFIVTEAKNLF